MASQPSVLSKALVPKTRLILQILLVCFNYLNDQSMFILDMEVEGEVCLGGVVADLALELAGVLPSGVIAQNWMVRFRRNQTSGGNGGYNSCRVFVTGRQSFAKKFLLFHHLW